jgi:hypothetical protein
MLPWNFRRYVEPWGEPGENGGGHCGFALEVSKWDWVS